MKKERKNKISPISFECNDVRKSRGNPGVLIVLKDTFTAFPFTFSTLDDKKFLTLMILL